MQSSTNIAGGWQGTLAEPTTTEIEARSLGDEMEEVTVRTLDPVSGRPCHYVRLQVLMQKAESGAMGNCGGGK